MTLLVRSHDMSIHLLSFQSLRDTRFAVKGYKSCTFCLNQSDTMKRAQKCHEHNSSSWISELFTVKETNPSKPVGSSGECFHSGHAGVWTSFKIKKGLDMGFGWWRDCLAPFLGMICSLLFHSAPSFSSSLPSFLYPYSPYFAFSLLLFMGNFSSASHTPSTVLSSSDTTITSLPFWSLQSGEGIKINQMSTKFSMLLQT